MFIAGHSILRFIPCYKSGGGIWEFEKKMKVRFSLNQKRVNALAPPVAYNGLAVWFCKPTTPLQFNDKLSKAYKLYRLLYAGRSKTQKL